MPIDYSALQLIDESSNKTGVLAFMNAAFNTLLPNGSGSSPAAKEQFAKDNSFVLQLGSNIEFDLKGGESYLLSMNGGINQSKVKLAIFDTIPLPSIQNRLSGEVFGLTFMMEQLRLGRFGLGISQLRFTNNLQAYSLVRISDPRISNIPDLISLRNDIDPKYTALNYRFSFEPEWYITEIGSESDIQYTTYAHANPPVNTAYDDLSDYFADIYSIGKPWIECHNSSLFFIFMQGFPLEIYDTQARFMIVERTAQFLDNF